MRRSAVLFFFAMIFAGLSHAAIVTVTVTGTLGSGSWDSTTVSGHNVFGLGTNLSGDTFILTLTFDDSHGTNASYDCYGGSMYRSTATGPTYSTPYPQH
jgi:hypothetical protein